MSACISKNDAAAIQAAIEVLFNEHDVRKAEIASLKTDVATLKIDTATLKADLSHMKNALHLRQFASSFVRGIIRMSFADSWPTMSEDSRHDVLLSCRLHHLERGSYNPDIIYYADRSPFLAAHEAYLYFCDEVKERTELTPLQFRLALEAFKGESIIPAHPDLKDGDMARIPALIGEVCQCYPKETQENMHRVVHAAIFAEKSFHWMEMASQNL